MADNDIKIGFSATTDGLNNAIDSANTKLDKNKDAFNKSADSAKNYDKTLKDISDSLNQVNSSLNDNLSVVKRNSDILTGYLVVLPVLSGLVSGLEEAGSAIENFANNSAKLAKDASASALTRATSGVYNDALNRVQKQKDLAESLNTSNGKLPNIDANSILQNIERIGFTQIGIAAAKQFAVAFETNLTSSFLRSAIKSAEEFAQSFNNKLTGGSFIINKAINLSAQFSEVGVSAAEKFASAFTNKIKGGLISDALILASSTTSGNAGVVGDTLGAIIGARLTTAVTNYFAPELITSLTGAGTIIGSFVGARIGTEIGVVLGATVGGIIAGPIGVAAGSLIGGALAASAGRAFSASIGGIIGSALTGGLIGSIGAIAGSSAFGQQLTEGVETLALAFQKVYASITRTYASFEIYFSGLDKISLNALAATGSINNFINAVGRTGNVKENLDEILETIKLIPNTTDKMAVSIENLLASIPNYTIEANKSLLETIKIFSSNGTEALAAAQKIKEAFSDEQNGGAKLATLSFASQPQTNSVGDLSGQLINADKIREDFAAIKDSLSTNQQLQYLDTSIKKLKDVIALNKTMANEEETHNEKTNFIVQALSSYWGVNVEKTRDYVNTLQSALYPLQQQYEILQRMSQKYQEQQEFVKALNNENLTSSQLMRTQEQIKTLDKNQFRAISANSAPVSSNDLDEGTAKKEFIAALLAEAGNQGKNGMLAVANVANNRALTNYSGYGDDIYSQLTAKAPGSKYHQFSYLNDDEQDKENYKRARNISPDNPKYKDAEDIYNQLKSGNLKDITNGATSYYNASISNPSWAAKLTNKSQIGDHTFGNTPESPPVINSTVSAKITEEREKLAEQEQKLKDNQNGGTEAQLVQLKITKEQLANGEDELSQAEKMLDVHKNSSALSGKLGPQAQTSAQFELAGAQKTYDEKVKAFAIAQAEYELSQKPDSFKGTQEELETRKQIIDIQRTGIIENSTLDLQLQKQKQVLQDAYDKQQIENQKARANLDLASMQPGNKATFAKQKQVATIGVDNDSSDQEKIASATRLAQINKQEQDQETQNLKQAENTQYQIAISALQEKLQLYKQEAQGKQLTRQQELVGEQSINQQIQSLTTSHYQKLLELDKNNEQAKFQDQQSFTQTVANEQQKQLQAVQQAQIKIQQQYQQTAQQASQTIGGAITNVITGHQKLGQAVGQILQQMLSKYITYGVQMVLMNTGNVGKMVSEFITGENLKTAAVITGNTARQASNVASQGASAASNAIVNQGIIQSDAARTFGGVFAFLAPLLGPAAAGPAAGSMAQVEAVGSLASFAVGAWNLPRDMVAQVHQGETILPAGAASAFRQMASGGMNQGGGDVHVHHSTNFTVQAIDSGSVKKFFANNGTEIMRSINNGVKLGTNLGFNKLKG